MPPFGINNSFTKAYNPNPVIVCLSSKILVSNKAERQAVTSIFKRISQNRESENPGETK